MSLLKNVKTGIQRSALKMVVYGQEGVGKTSFAAGSHLPNRQALLIDLEKGSGAIDMPKIGAENYEGFMKLLEELITADHPFKTVIVDTIDWLEQRMIETVVRRGKSSKIKSLADFGFGKGHIMLKEETEFLIKRLEALRLKGVDIIMLAHSHVKTFTPADDANSSYDRWEMKLEKKTAPLWKEWPDVVAFARFHVRYEKNMNNKTTAHSNGDRIINLKHSASYDAKCRIPIGAEIDEIIELNYNAFRSRYEAAFQPQQKKEEEF